MNKSLNTIRSSNRFLTNQCRLIMLLAAIIASLAGLNAFAATPQSKVQPLIFNPKVIFPKVANSFVYIAKFICGPQASAIQIGRFTTYSALQPGNYATALNIFTLYNNQPTIEVYVSVDGNNTNSLVAQLPVSRVFETHTITCDDIFNTLGVNAGTEAYEGFLYISRAQSDLDVKAVYTFISRDQYGEWRGVDANGKVIVNPEAGVYSIGGAGGLGLGASIDVEHIKPLLRKGVTLK